jgi:hypothetical protein
MKILFLSALPIFQQAKKDMYIDLIEKEYEVILLSLKKLLDKDYSLVDEIPGCCTIESMHELEEKFKSITDKKIIITDLKIKYLKNFYKLIKKYDIDIIHMSKNYSLNSIIDSNEESLVDNKLFRKIKVRVKKISPIVWVYNLIKYGSCKYDYFLSENNYYPYNSKKYVKIHHLKYDEFLAAKNEAPIIKTKYILFIDSYLPFHPDFTYHLKTDSIEPIKYFKLLNEFFKYLEDKYGLEVVISAHPKADYESDTFNGKKIIKYHTATLIKHSEFVITHNSTSIYNVVLENKPLILLYYDEMFEKGTRRVAIGTLAYSRLLNSSLVNLEKSYEHSLRIDSQAYNDFKYKYIVNKERERQSNENLLLEFLRDYNAIKS